MYFIRYCFNRIRSFYRGYKAWAVATQLLEERAQRDYQRLMRENAIRRLELGIQHSKTLAEATAENLAFEQEHPELFNHIKKDL